MYVCEFYSNGVSVPIRGSFNLTEFCYACYPIIEVLKVSVPIRGSFNLTLGGTMFKPKNALEIVSVPIRGSFNLTLSLKQQIFTGSKMQKTAEITN